MHFAVLGSEDQGELQVGPWAMSHLTLRNENSDLEHDLSGAAQPNQAGVSASIHCLLPWPLIFPLSLCVQAQSP